VRSFLDTNLLVYADAADGGDKQLAAIATIREHMLAGTGVISTQVAIWTAIAVGLVVLGVLGVRFARIRGFGTLRTCAAVAANLAFGVLVVVLKLLLAH